MNQGGTALSQSTTPQVDLVQTQASTVQQAVGGISQSPPAHATQVAVAPLQAQADAVKEDGTAKSQTTSPQADADAAQAEAKHVVEQAGIELSKMHSPGRVTATLIPAGNKANDAIDQITRLDDVAQPLLSKLKIFTEVVDKIAEVHPYAKMAWSVLSAAHKTILAQSDRDDRIQQLYEIMDNVYAIVIQAETSEIESHKKVIGCMVRQTTECGYFITSYAKNKNFWLRLAKNAISGADIAIENFRAKFEDLKKEFHEEAVRSTEITVMRTEILAASILDEVKNLATEVDLKDLPYANDARFRSDKQCLAGTREEVLDEITNWINSSDDSKKNVFLLCGAAGTGKS
ncbi:hypothetical protein BD410DRAFT_833076, partial [Rickenella mellea]